MAAEKRAPSSDQQKYIKKINKNKGEKNPVDFALHLACRVRVRAYLLSELSWLTEGRSCVRLESELEL